MNSNFVRTMLTWAAILVTAVPVVTGCVADAFSHLDCSASWIPPQYAAIISIAFLGINQVMKLMDVGLVLPTATVSNSGKPNTVSPGAVVPKR